MEDGSSAEMIDEFRAGQGVTATLQRRRIEISPGDTAGFLLKVIEGPDSGATFRVDGTHPAPVLVGQGPACVVRLTDREVSRRHLSLEVAKAKLRIRDLDSTNGTFVDGITTIEALLQGDEIVRLGRTALKVERAETSTRRSKRDASATTCFIASRSGASSSRRCGGARETYRIWSGTSAARWGTHNEFLTMCC